MATSHHVRTGRSEGPHADDVRAAMMSVYYHALGRQLELRGAPAVLLIPAVRPMPLEQALATLREGQEAAAPAEADHWQDIEREALWTLLRSTPPPPFSNRVATIPFRYPGPVRSFAGEGFIKRYDDKREEYRKQATLFAAALIAYSRNDMPAFKALKDVHNGDKPTAFAENCAPLKPRAYLQALGEQSGDERKRCQERLRKLEDEVGMSLQTFVNDLADASAFMEVRGARPKTPFVVYPTAAVVVQDAPSLTVRVTATSLVTAESLKQIALELDPQNWKEWSTAFRNVHYVEERSAGFFGLREQPEKGKSLAKDKTWLLREEVEIMSGLNPTVIAEFENVLNITLDVDEDKDTADLTFGLYRSIKSRYLWDERPGGILLDEGYTKIRPVFPAADEAEEGDKLWRVTIRKALRFADRTPATWGDTPLQFGQSLNYLAPASLSWWLQSDIYNAARHASKAVADGR